MTYHSPTTLKPVRHWPVFKQQYAITTFNTLYKNTSYTVSKFKVLWIANSGPACLCKISDVQKSCTLSLEFTAVQKCYRVLIQTPCKATQYSRPAKFGKICSSDRDEFQYTEWKTNQLTYNYTYNSMYNFYLCIVLYIMCNKTQW
jgi:hypothetical protein